MNRPHRCTEPAFRAFASRVAGILLCALALSSATLEAQEGRALNVTSDPAGAVVFLGATLLGATPLSIPLDDSLTGGRGVIVLKIVGGDPRRWFVPVLTDSVRIPWGGSEGETDFAPIARHYDLPIALRLTSDPPGAEVFLGDSLLGTTPLLTMVPRSVSRLNLSKDGFEPQSAMLQAGMADYRIELVPQGPPGIDSRSPLSIEAGKTYAPVLIAAGSAVVAGAAAAWLKNLADRSYDEYRSTGDGATLDRVRRYDIFSGISLAVAEISLGYLVIDLLSR